MSVDAKLFVTCGKDKAIYVGHAVVEALGAYVFKIIKENEYKFSEQKEHRVSLPSVSSYGFESFNIMFGNGDGDSKTAQKRLLSMSTSCSTDYSDIYEGDKIIFSMGCWGSYDEVMMIVAEAVKSFGDVYYDFNDCDDQDFVKLFY